MTTIQKNEKLLSCVLNVILFQNIYCPSKNKSSFRAQARKVLVSARIKGLAKVLSIDERRFMSFNFTFGEDGHIG